MYNWFGTFNGTDRIASVIDRCKILVPEDVPWFLVQSRSVYYREREREGGREGEREREKEREREIS